MSHLFTDVTSCCDFFALVYFGAEFVLVYSATLTTWLSDHCPLSFSPSFPPPYRRIIRFPHRADSSSIRFAFRDYWLYFTVFFITLWTVAFSLKHIRIVLSSFKIFNLSFMDGRDNVTKFLSLNKVAVNFFHLSF